MEIIAIIDGRVKTVTEASIRRHLKLEDFDGIWNGYLRKGRKTKPKRQNRTRNGKAWKRQSQDKAQ
ncbi:hypothetical protein Tco_0202704, partial [Tanacetum coccineum]